MFGMSQLPYEVGVITLCFGDKRTLSVRRWEPLRYRSGL